MIKLLAKHQQQRVQRQAFLLHIIYFFNIGTTRNEVNLVSQLNAMPSVVEPQQLGRIPLQLGVTQALSDDFE